VWFLTLPNISFYIQYRHFCNKASLSAIPHEKLLCQQLLYFSPHYKDFLHNRPPSSRFNIVNQPSLDAKLQLINTCGRQQALLTNNFYEGYVLCWAARYRLSADTANSYPVTERYCNLPVSSYSFSTRSQNCEKRLLASPCLSFCPSVRMEHLGCHWTDFYKIWY
jgi:hypothetical protein